MATVATMEQDMVSSARNQLEQISHTVNTDNETAIIGNT